MPDEPRAASACDDCGVTDDLPRHHVAVPPRLQVISRHFACCARAGCPDGSCDQILAVP